MMRFVEVSGRRYAQFDRLRNNNGLTHAFSTRPFDVSMRTDGLAGQRADRRRQMVLDFQGDPQRLCCCDQIHEPRIAAVDEAANKHRGRAEPPDLDVQTPRLGEHRLTGCDAVISNTPGLSLMTFSADCPLVVVYDPRRRAVGLAHASWRNTVAPLVTRLIDAMCARYDCDPATMHAGVGPSAGPTQYEVKDDVYRMTAGLPNRERFFHRTDDRMYFDLWEANRAQLTARGLPPENVEVAGVCTMTSTDVFYSFRREGPGCGHFCLMAMLE